MIEQAAYTVLFYFFAAAMVVAAVGVTLCRRMLRAAMCLMAVLLVSAALYVMLKAYFLAGIQVLVYVGGVVVLIVFAVMLTQSLQEPFERPSALRKTLAAVGAIVFAGVGVYTLLHSGFNADAAVAAPAAADNTASIGMKLMDTGPGGYVLPFEIISVLLLAAAVGAIVVARKSPPRDQPFTTGGDQPGEAGVALPKSQKLTRPSAPEVNPL
jgi:NADH-quinone oxidoreductase subunit J